MDNAANNIAAMRELELLLEAREMLMRFDAVDRRIPCFPHIINICVTHTIKAYSDADFGAVSDSWVGALSSAVVDKGLYLEALTMDPISLGRDIVRIVRSSGQRRVGFRDSIINGNANQWYTGNPIEIPVVELLRDVRTRWDSVYIMINRLRAVRLVSCRYSLICRILLTSPGY